MRPRTQESLRHSHHDRLCTGVSLLFYSAAVQGQQVMVISGQWCPCSKGRWMAKGGPSALALEVSKAARRRGPGWVTTEELAQAHFLAESGYGKAAAASGEHPFRAAGLPMDGIVRVGP